jgi:hypothetical protein
MGNPITYPVAVKDIVTAMLKAKGIHEGIWGLNVSFGFTATNMEVNGGTRRPGVLITIESYCLERTSQITDLSVDAAVVNPRTRIIDPFLSH